MNQIKKAHGFPISLFLSGCALLTATNAIAAPGQPATHPTMNATGSATWLYQPAGTGTVKLGSVTNAAKYKLYVDSTVYEVPSISNNVPVEIQVPLSQGYRYLKYQACDSNNDCGAMSDDVRLYIYGIPGEPVGLIANPTTINLGQSSTLSWSNAAGITYYGTTYRITHPNGNISTMNHQTGAGSDLYLVIPPNYGSNTYKVSACNPAGQCGTEATVSVNVLYPIPAVPVNAPIARAVNNPDNVQWTYIKAGTSTDVLYNTGIAFGEDYHVKIDGTHFLTNNTGVYNTVFQAGYHQLAYRACNAGSYCSGDSPSQGIYAYSNPGIATIELDKVVADSNENVLLSWGHVPGLIDRHSKYVIEEFYNGMTVERTIDHDSGTLGGSTLVSLNGQDLKRIRVRGDNPNSTPGVWSTPVYLSAKMKGTYAGANYGDSEVAHMDNSDVTNPVCSTLNDGTAEFAIDGSDLDCLVDEVAERGGNTYFFRGNYLSNSYYNLFELFLTRLNVRAPQVKVYAYMATYQVLPDGIAGINDNMVDWAVYFAAIAKDHSNFAGMAIDDFDAKHLKDPTNFNPAGLTQIRSILKCADEREDVAANCVGATGNPTSVEPLKLLTTIYYRKYSSAQVIKINGVNTNVALLPDSPVELAKYKLGNSYLFDGVIMPFHYREDSNCWDCASWVDTYISELSVQIQQIKTALGDDNQTPVYTMLYATGYADGKVSSANYIKSAGESALLNSDGVIMYHMQTRYMEKQFNAEAKSFEPTKEVAAKRQETINLFN